MRIERIVVGPLETNCYLLTDDSSEELPTAVIDPGAEPERIEEEIRRRKLTPVLILNTHGHGDHTMGVAHLRKAFDAKYFVHEADAALEDDHDDDLAELLRSFAGAMPPKPDGYLSDGEELRLGSLRIRVIHTPGHTPGGVCFLADDALFTGDTLFAGGVGRTDLPGGSTETLMRSIQERILTLEGDLRVFPGHGLDSTLAVERATNPWLADIGRWAEP